MLVYFVDLGLKTNMYLNNNRIYSHQDFWQNMHATCIGDEIEYCDGVGCHVLCLRHGNPVWQHIRQSTTATSRHRRDMTSDVQKRRLTNKQTNKQIFNGWGTRTRHRSSNLAEKPAAKYSGSIFHVRKSKWFNRDFFSFHTIINSWMSIEQLHGII